MPITVTRTGCAYSGKHWTGSCGCRPLRTARAEALQRRFPSVRAAHYNPKTFVDYTVWNNNEIVLVPMIENPSALADLDNIFAHADVHMAVYAEGDYGFSVGEGMDMLNGTKVKKGYQQVLAAGAKHNVAVVGGPVLAGDPESCRQAIEAGVRVFSIGLDAVVFRDPESSLVDWVRKSANVIGGGTNV